MVYFKGFGDSSLDFELHFWVMQENNGLQITSEVALAVMQLLDDAGIEIPFPQRDLHVRSIDPNVASQLPSSEAQKIGLRGRKSVRTFSARSGRRPPDCRRLKGGNSCSHLPIRFFCVAQVCI